MANKTKYHSLVREALGRSDAFLAFQERLAAVAKADRPVIILGERGTGKELAAVRLHYHSRRWEGPLVAVNCAAFSKSLLESELFGHEPGAFTGAVRLRQGRFEAAHKGTLFLDEIGTMPRTMQEKILRVVEYQIVERLGGTSPLEVDTRVIAATNADLRAMSAQGRFRSDLLDRLAFEVLRVPPLRERTGDVPLLAGHFAARMAVELGRTEPPRFTAAALRALEEYSWPGNVRELKNVVERAVFRAGEAALVTEVVLDPFPESALLPPADAPLRPLDRPVQGPQPPSPPAAADRDHEVQARPLERLDLPEAIAKLEQRYLLQALRQARFNQRRAAELLGLRYHQFRGLYRKHFKTLQPGDEAQAETKHPAQRS